MDHSPPPRDYTSRLLDALASEPLYVQTRGSRGFDVDMSMGEVRLKSFQSRIPALISPASLTWDYAAPQGNQDLREAYLETLRASGHDVHGLSAENVVITAGAKQALWLAFMLSVRRHSTVLVPSPGWPPYRIMARALDAKCLTYDPTIADLPDHLCSVLSREHVDVLVLNSPNNPTGVELDEGDICQIHEWATKEGTRIISDEVYRLFASRTASIAGHVEANGASHFLADSLSKACAAAGLRIGFLLAGHKDVEAAIHLRSTIDSCPPTVTQAIALALLRSDPKAAETKAFAGQALGQLNRVLRQEGHDVVSSGAIYTWIKPSSSLKGDLRHIICRGAKIRGVPGDLFDRPGYLRLCPTSDDPATLELLRTAQPKGATNVG